MSITQCCESPALRVADIEQRVCNQNITLKEVKVVKI